MKKILVVLIMFSSVVAKAQDIPVIKIDGLEQILRSTEKEILIINFWATWCGPCIKELPHFESLYRKRTADQQVVLVSLDFVEKIDRVKRFVRSRNIEAPVVLLDDIDYNSWIDKVDPSWQGAIPATLFINTKTGERKFVAKELDEDQLHTIIKEISKG